MVLVVSYARMDSRGEQRYRKERGYTSKAFFLEEFNHFVLPPPACDDEVSLPKYFHIHARGIGRVFWEQPVLKLFRE